MISKSWVILLSALALIGCQGADSKRSDSPGADASPQAAEATTGTDESAGGTSSRIAEAPTPTPTPPPRILPAGTQLPLVFDTTVSSATNHVGDAVAANLASEVRVDDNLVLPVGTAVKGRVTAVAGAGRVKGRARLAVSFDTLVYDGRDYPLTAEPIDITAPKSKGKDAKIIGGGAAAGAIIGAITGGKKGALIGTGVGGAAGTGAVLATKGEEVTLPAGTNRTIAVTSDLQLE